MSLELKVLPDSLVKEAEADGLLTPQAIEQLLRQEIRRRRINRLFETADRLAESEITPPTAAEIEAEIHAARAARKR